MLFDPQRFNLYGYVRNSPLTLIDPTGEAIELTGDENERAKKLELLRKTVGERGGRVSVRKQRRTSYEERICPDVLAMPAGRLVDFRSCIEKNSVLVRVGSYLIMTKHPETGEVQSCNESLPELLCGMVEKRSRRKGRKPLHYLLLRRGQINRGVSSSPSKNGTLKRDSTISLRYYSSVQGRFTSPDEFTGGADKLYSFADEASENPTFYAELSNPQSLNKYQYTYNNPLNLVDPDGHCPVCGRADAQGPRRMVDSLLNLGSKVLDVMQTGLS